jgi:hypothetical protein
MKKKIPTTCRPARHPALAVYAGVALTVGLPLATAADRSQEKDPNWRPPPTRNTETEYPKRVYNGDKRVVPVQPEQVKAAKNKVDAAQRITETSRSTVPWGLHPYLGDRLPGVGYSALTVDPREGSADRSARTLVEQALAGKQLNTDPKSLDYLRYASRSINLAPVTRTWVWAFGSETFIRISGNGSLEASVGAGNAKYIAQAKVVGTFLNRTRELGTASVKSVAPASPTAVKSSVLLVDVMGRPVVNETITDTKPYTKSRAFKLVPEKVWWSGSISVPWIGLGMAFKMTSDPVAVTPRLAIGNASGAGDVTVSTGLSTLGEVPLVDLWGFAKILARIDFKPLDGKLVGGESIGLVWSSAGGPVLRDARFARSEVGYGAVNLKIKAQWGFEIFGWSLWKDEKTLWSVFKHDGKKTERELFSTVRETPLK